MWQTLHQKKGASSMQQIKFMKTKQTQGEKRDDLKEEGGKPL